MKPSRLCCSTYHVIRQRFANRHWRRPYKRERQQSFVLQHLKNLLVLLMLSVHAGTVYSDALDDRWHAIEFGDVTMYTDLDAEDAKALAEHVIHFRAILDKALPKELEQLPDAPKLKLLVFERRADFAKLMKPRHFAAFTQPSLKETLLVIAPSRTRSTLFKNTRHELVHYQLRNQSVGFPPWYDEGLAVMLEHVILEHKREDKREDKREEEKEGIAGMVEVTSDLNALYGMYRGPVREIGVGSLSDLTETSDVTRWPVRELERFYGLSGQFVHFLSSVHDEALERYLKQQDRGLAAALEQPMFGVEKEFTRYRRARNKDQLVFSAEINDVELLSRGMHESEVALVHARAAENANTRRALKLYRSIVALKPESADAFIDLARGYVASGDYDGAARALDEAAKLLGSPNAQYLVLRSMLKLRECGAVGLEGCRDVWQATSRMLRQALDIDPGELEGIFLLGVVDLYRGRPGSALNYLRAVHRYVPWAPRVNYHLGECLRILGDPAAVIYLRNARAWSHDEQWTKLAEASLELVGR